MTGRDHFAAAALAGLTHLEDCSAGPARMEFVCKMAFAWADAMLRERASTNSPEISSTLTIHDAAPAARVTDGSIGTDKAEPLPVAGTGYTPEPQRTPGKCSKPREGTSGPVAWAVEAGGEFEASFCGRYGREDAADWAEQSNDKIVPLYRKPQPTLTDAEREAVEWAIEVADSLAECQYTGTGGEQSREAATLRGLLERTK